MPESTELSRVYELRYNACDELHYPLGMYTDLEVAISDATQPDSWRLALDDPDEHVALAIVSWPLNTTVSWPREELEIHWTCDYSNEEFGPHDNEAWSWERVDK